MNTQTGTSESFKQVDLIVLADDVSVMEQKLAGVIDQYSHAIESWVGQVQVTGQLDECCRFIEGMQANHWMPMVFLALDQSCHATIHETFNRLSAYDARLLVVWLNDDPTRVANRVYAQIFEQSQHLLEMSTPVTDAQWCQLIMAMSKMQRRINQQAWTMRLFENDQDEQKVIKQLAEANVNAACIMAELEEARDKAQEADRAKGNFLANITHELRTPLVAIMGFAEIMRDDLASDPEHSEFLSCIYNNGQDLLEILDSILLMTLLDSDELEVMPVSSNPYKLFRRVLQNHVGKAVENGLIIHLHDCVDAQIPKVLQIDEKWVEQILNRLVHNALKFTPNGHIDLSLNWSETPTGHRLHFAVKDTGIGINPQAMPSIFEPFTQADNSASRSYGGLGLGLAISRKLARALGGDIHVSSVPGQGSFFELVLNFAEQQDVVPA